MHRCLHRQHGFTVCVPSLSRLVSSPAIGHSLAAFCLCVSLDTLSFSRRCERICTRVSRGAASRDIISSASAFPPSPSVLASQHRRTHRSNIARANMRARSVSSDSSSHLRTLSTSFRRPDHIRQHRTHNHRRTTSSRATSCAVCCARSPARAGPLRARTAVCGLLLGLGRDRDLVVRHVERLHRVVRHRVVALVRV